MTCGEYQVNYYSSWDMKDSRPPHKERGKKKHEKDEQQDNSKRQKKEKNQE